MASERYTWDPRSRRYRDVDSGRFISVDVATTIRDRVLDAQAVRAGYLVDSLVDGTMTVQAFDRELRARVKRVYVTEYLLGRGGRYAMTADDRQVLGDLVHESSVFVRSFVERVAAGDFTEAEVRSRTRGHVSAAVKAHERAKARSYSADLDLPAYPGDGSTKCVGNCRCRWDVREKDDQWEATWKTKGGAGGCEDCERRGGEWNPFVQTK